MTSSPPLIRTLLSRYVKPRMGLLLVALVFMVLAALTTGAMAQLMQPIIDDVFTAADHSRLWPVSIAVFTVFLVRGLATYGHGVLMNRLGQGIVADIQKQTFGHLMAADMAFHHRHASGELMSRMIADVTAMRAAISDCITGMGKSVLTLVVLVGVMFYQDWVLSLAAFVVFPLAMLIVTRIGKRLRKVSTHTQEELAAFSAHLSDVFQGIRHVKANNRQAHEQHRADAVIDRLFHLLHKAFRVSAVSAPVNEVLSGLAIVTVIVYGGTRVMDGHSTAGSFFSFITAFLLAYEPIKRLAKLNNVLQAGLAAAARVMDVLDQQPTICDVPEAIALPQQDLATHGIRFDDVTFAYTDGPPVLAGLSLACPAGKTVALVGQSGAGKSTLFNLILRFYDVQNGAVQVGGQDVRAVTLESLRANIALVTQDTALFDGTVYDNIAYSVEGADRGAVEAAAKAAHAHAFIMALPQGYDTPVGERGAALSGGQRQRVAIARAFLKDAPILLLDEATSALDADSEQAVREALHALCTGRTTLVIAHRLSTIRDADMICVLQDGQVMATGTHAELEAGNALYGRWLKLQQGQEAET